MQENENDLFSQRLREIRKRSGVPQSSIATYLSITVSAYSIFETGKGKPSYTRLIALADYFGVSLDYLVGRSDDPRREEYEPIRLQKERAGIIAKETGLLETLPGSLLPAYNEAKEKNKKNPEKLQQIIDTFTKMAKDYHSLTK